jgi:hypothetical protein
VVCSSNQGTSSFETWSFDWVKESYTCITTSMLIVTMFSSDDPSQQEEGHMHSIPSGGWQRRWHLGWMEEHWDFHHPRAGNGMRAPRCPSSTSIVTYCTTIVTSPTLVAGWCTNTRSSCRRSSPTPSYCVSRSTTERQARLPPPDNSRLSQTRKSPTRATMTTTIEMPLGWAVVIS